MTQLTVFEVRDEDHAALLTVKRLGVVNIIPPLLLHVPGSLAAPGALRHQVITPTIHGKDLPSSHTKIFLIHADTAPVLLMKGAPGVLIKQQMRPNKACTHTQRPKKGFHRNTVIGYIRQHHGYMNQKLTRFNTRRGRSHLDVELHELGKLLIPVPYGDLGYLSLPGYLALGPPLVGELAAYIDAGGGDPRWASAAGELHL